MNNKRRKQIQEAIMKIESLVQNILDEEQEAFDNLPDNLKETDNGIASEEAQESLDAALNALEDAIGYLEEI